MARTLSCTEGLTPGAILGIRVDAQIWMAVVGGVRVQVLVPVLPDPKPGDGQLLRQDLCLDTVVGNCGILTNQASSTSSGSSL